MKRLLLCLLIAPATYASINEAWRDAGNPELMSYFFEKNISKLPLNGTVTDQHHYWSGDYWALKKGSINYRWFAKHKVGFNYLSPTREEARRMTIPELAALSPAEKYDLMTGRYDYPLKNEVEKIADAGAETWEGMCHGWSPATMNHEEPRPKLIKNPDGIDIPFGSTDIKALLSYYYAYIYRAPDTFQVGRRCYKGPFLNFDKDCHEDMNAGSFHIILTNRIGIDGKGFIADMERFEQVWNHPFMGYDSQLIRETKPTSDSAPGTTKRQELRTTVTYLDENGHDWHPVIGTDKQLTKTVIYQYVVELNSSGEIIGGEWISKHRPDFLWMMARPENFEGSLSQLRQLLED